MLLPIHFPRRVYEALPAAYGVAGVAALLFSGDWPGRASGALLAVTGLAIRVVRKRHRRREAAAALAQSSRFEARPSRLAATSAFLRAVAPPPLGHVDIDRQHRALATMCATLHVAFEHNDDDADLELQLHALVDALEVHLDAEDKALRRLGVAHAAEDAAADRATLAAARRRVDEARGSEADMAAAIRALTQHVASHLGRRHPLLPSLDAALQALRGAPATAA